MTARPVIRAVSGGVTRRKVQTIVIFTVLLVSTASATLGLGLLLDSNGPFQHSFAAQRGAEVTDVHLLGDVRRRVVDDGGLGVRDQLHAEPVVGGQPRHQIGHEAIGLADARDVERRGARRARLGRISDVCCVKR